jgi:hypothetical protein
MMRTLCRMPWLLLVLAGLPVLAWAEPLADGLRRCAGEADRERRLACYDAIVRSLPQVEADQFGMSTAIAKQRDPESLRHADTAVLPATIAALQEGRSGGWVFTLDNGQVWVQVEPKPGIRFEVGEKVQIERGALGSLWLAADRGRKARVRRVR